MNIQAWAEQRLQYSRARRGRFERGAQIGECGLVEAMAFAMARQQARSARTAIQAAPVALVATPPAA